MSYSMHSPPTQGYPNPVNDVYTSRAYPGHLMSPGTMNNYSPGYLRGDPDPYSNAVLQYSNGVGAGLQPGNGSSHYSSTTANHHHQQQHPQSHHSSISSHHTYPGSMNHFGHQHHQQQQQDVYNSCVGSTRNSNSYPTTTATSLNIARNSAMNAKSYWSCDPSLSQPSPSNHCYPQAAAAAQQQQVQHNSPHNKTAPTPNWNRSPNIIHSPTSSTPSPIPCPPTTPHPFGSSPHLAHPVESSSSKPPPPPPYNGQIIPSHASNLNNGSTNANINNCNNSNNNNNSNPLQSLQKMVQIDSSETNDDLRNHYDSCSTTTSSTPTATVPTMAIVNHHGQHQLNPPPPSTTITHSINSSSLDSNDVNNYPTYYNLDQNRLCATPQTVYPTNSNISSAQSSNVPFKTNSHSPPESRSVVVGASSRENNTNKQQEKLNNDSSDIRICSMRFSQNKLNRTVNSSKNHSSDTCSNESPTAQSVNHKMSATGTTNSIPESMIHADQTHDSLNSFRGSETTANSRDSVKSSDSDAVSSYTVSQCSTPNNSTSNANTWKSGGNNFLTNSPSKSWWSENSLPQTISADCNQTSYSGQNVNYSRMSQSNPSSNHPSSWSQHMAISNQSSPMLANHHHHHHNNHHHQSSYGSQMDGIVKKKRGRPFGSKNRRSLDTTPIPNNSNNPLIDPNKIRKRKSILVDIGINTNLSFDVQASWNRDDDSMKFSSQQQDLAPSIQQQHHSIPPAMVANNKRNKKVAGPVIRIDKLEKNDEKFSIVNNSLKTQDEERDSKFAKSHHHHHHYQSKISSEIGMLSRKNNYSTTKKSFLSSNHSHNNSCNSEKNWFCILCHKGPHYKSLGDLYGPYFITYEHSSQPILNVDNLESSSQDELKTPGPSSWLENNHHPEKNDTTTTNANETTASTSSSEKRSLRKRPMDLNNSDDHNHNRKNKSNSSTNNNQFNEIHNNGSSSSTKIESEVWIHEDCIVWSNNVYLEGSKIRNLEPAIVESFENICTKCKQPGATLGCIYKNCTVSPLHYLCAKEKDCDLDEEKFILSCSKHKKRRILPKDTDDNDKKINDEDDDIVENIEDVDPSQENL